MRIQYETSTCNDPRRPSVPASNSLLSTVQISTHTTWLPHHHQAVILASRPVANTESQHGDLRPVVNRSWNSHVAALAPLKNFSSELELQPPLSAPLSPTQSMNRSLSARYYEVPGYAYFVMLYFLGEGGGTCV